MTKLLTSATLFPMLLGIVVGAIFFAFGAIGDAPGLSLIGLMLAFLMIVHGVYKAGLIKKYSFAVLLSFCFGVGAILFSIVLLLDGEFGGSPGRALVGVAIGAALIALGAVRHAKNVERT